MPSKEAVRHRRAVDQVHSSARRSPVESSALDTYCFGSIRKLDGNTRAGSRQAIRGVAAFLPFNHDLNR
jgi:hypothetical protein